jgi:hypothetical protein
MGLIYLYLYSFLLEAVNHGAIVGPEGFYQRKIPMTQSGTELATVRLVAQCLNQLHPQVLFRYLPAETKENLRKIPAQSMRKVRICPISGRIHHWRHLARLHTAIKTDKHTQYEDSCSNSRQKEAFMRSKFQ